tara:strand:+ start:5646 stop:6083 length:438 start_codon:yes stop_codon:yes gene_type:complete
MVDNLYIQNTRFHHIGYACDDIEKFKSTFIPFSENKDFSLRYDDVGNNVKVGFLDLINGIKIELIETLDHNKMSPINKYINLNSSGFHHICFESKNFMDQINSMKNDYLIVSLSDEGFENRKISFFLPKSTKTGPLIEIVSLPIE